MNLFLMYEGLTGCISVEKIHLKQKNWQLMLIMLIIIFSNPKTPGTYFY